MSSKCRVVEQILLKTASYVVYLSIQVRIYVKISKLAAIQCTRTINSEKTAVIREERFTREQVSI